MPNALNNCTHIHTQMCTKTCAHIVHFQKPVASFVCAPSIFVPFAADEHEWKLSRRGRADVVTIE